MSRAAQRQLQAVDEHLELLRDIAHRLDRIERRLLPRGLSSEDSTILALLLPAIAGNRGSEPFTVREVLAHPAFQALAEDLSPSGLGMLFSKAAASDECFGGFTIERLGTSKNARRWRVLEGLGAASPA